MWANDEEEEQEIWDLNGLDDDEKAGSGEEQCGGCSKWWKMIAIRSTSHSRYLIHIWYKPLKIFVWLVNDSFALPE
jgi:hypothetical protein